MQRSRTLFAHSSLIAISSTINQVFFHFSCTIHFVSMTRTCHIDSQVSFSDTHEAHVTGKVTFLVVVVTDANATLGRQSVSPPSTNLHIGLRDATVTEQKPESEDWLGQNIKHSVRHNFTIDGRLAGTIGEAPHTGMD